MKMNRVQFQPELGRPINHARGPGRRRNALAASTSCTASCLNSSAYRARVVFVISALLACIEPLSKAYAFRGQGHIMN